MPSALTTAKDAFAVSVPINHLSTWQSRGAVAPLPSQHRRCLRLVDLHLLNERVEGGEAHDAVARGVVDEFIAANGLDCPEEPWPPVLRDGFGQPIRTSLDLGTAGIASIVWGTGYDFDLAWVRFPILDGEGEPRHERGVTPVPGLYVLGFTLRRRPRSLLLPYVGVEAENIAAAISGRH